MLQITIPESEWFDERTNTFEKIKETRLQLEHSLISLHRWEQKWGKPFFSEKPKSREECNDYVRCMTITKNVDPIIYSHIPLNILDEIDRYIEAPMTATWFGGASAKNKHSNAVTAEVIYYWMIALNIPFECEKWHLNSLMTLIRVCNAKNTPPKKQSKRDMLSQRTALNRARKAKR